MNYINVFLCSSLCALCASAREPSSPITRHTHDGREKQRPAWSPDGRTLAFARHDGGGAHIWQYLLEPDRPESLRRLTGRETPDYDAAFLPDGSALLIVAVSQSGTQGNLDIGRIGPDGEGLELLVSDADFGGKLSHQDWPAPSPDGTRFAFSSTHEGNQEIYVAALDGSDVTRITRHPGHDAHPCWSPDGKRVAFATDRWGGLELASASADGTGLIRLTESPGLDAYPAWSPDGERIAFVSARDGDPEVYAMNADGSDPVNLSRHPGRDSFPAWTPDGLGVTFVSDRDGGSDLYTMRVDRAAPADEPGP